MTLPLLELPELAGEDAEPKSRITLFRLGRFKHPRFGVWNITREVFASLLRNFQARVPVDLDHRPEKGGSTEAAGWITELQVEGDELYGSVEWTKLGAEAIREKRYLALSPTWSFDARDEHGRQLGPRLIGAGLTNRPFFSHTSVAAADGAYEPLEEFLAAGVMDADLQAALTADDGLPEAIVVDDRETARGLEAIAGHLLELQSQGMSDADVQTHAEQLLHTPSRHALEED